MPKRTSAKSGGELFIVDNSDDEWKALRYLREWCDYARGIDVATAYFEIGALLGLEGRWRQVDDLRVLMGDEAVSARTKKAFEKVLIARRERLDLSLELEKESNDFLDGVPAIVEAIVSGKVRFRVYRREKFHAKCYITHARSEVIGAAALVGSSNFTVPGLTRNIELNVQVTGAPVTVLQDWYEQHWDAAEDVTPDILRTIERHVQAFSPLDVWARSLDELFKRREISAGEWEKTRSRVWPVLDGYQREGYGQLLKIAESHDGAFLCDGVGLGKTFVGLMLLERLCLHENKRVMLLVPKSGRKAVWEAELSRHLPELLRSRWSNLAIYNHTDLSSSRRVRDMVEDAAQCDAIVIDEAHNFRNPGLAGTATKRESRYRILQRLAAGKQMFLLTATPVNNGVFDLMHLIQLFAHDGSTFASEGVHSIRGHFRTLEKKIRAANEVEDDALPEADIDQTVEVGPAREIFEADPLVRALVVQRSRAYVKASQLAESRGQAVFPVREPPRVADYTLSPLQQKLLDLVIEAFDRDRDLLKLAIYDLTEWRLDKVEVEAFEAGRRKQVVQLIRIGLIKKLESSTPAFALSCAGLFQRLLAFWRAQAGSGDERARLEVWTARHAATLDQVRALLTGESETDTSDDDEDEADDAAADDFDPLFDEGAYEALSPDAYDLVRVLEETKQDLEQLARFLEVLRDFTPENDGKLAALTTLMADDPVLSRNKVLIFTEFRATARHLRRRLRALGLEGVAQVDSTTHMPREQVVRAFAPYYNRSSSAELAADGLAETRVLISTDVLSEGLNLQDATRLINYDLHWNPVRLMQRVGRVDRRLNPEIEARLVADHPEQHALRGKVATWNFLPTKALEQYLRLYARLDRKASGIARLLGIESGKLLTPDDAYRELIDLNVSGEDALTAEEALRQELRQLLLDYPELEARLADLPNRIFSGREAIRVTGVFFCYALPGRAVDEDGDETWERDEARQVRWYFRDLDGGPVLEDLEEIAARIRSLADTPRRLQVDRETLAEARSAIERRIQDGYMRRVQAPAGAKPVLKAWMELN
jgi:superfamily II DNA or RNA helicase